MIGLREQGFLDAAYTKKRRDRMKPKLLLILMVSALNAGCVLAPSLRVAPPEPPPTPMIPHSAAAVAALSFASINDDNPAAEPINGFTSALGIVTVDNPFWSVEDTVLRRQTDYSGYAVELCDTLKDKFKATGLFPAVIELPFRAQEMARNGSFPEICSEWGVNLVLTGVMVSSNGVLTLSIHTSQGQHVFGRSFDDAWNAADVSGRIVSAINRDGELRKQQETSRGAPHAAQALQQPLVETAKVHLRCTFAEQKDGGGTTTMNAHGSPALLGAMIAGLIVRSASQGPDAEGVLTFFLDGKQVGGHIAPVDVGPVNRRYDWQTDVSVRPGKHRLIVGGLEKGPINTPRHVHYADFMIADRETKNIVLTPSEDKRQWSITVMPP